MTKENTITKSSGNVFADMDVPHPNEALAKAELAHKISDIIKKRKITQTEAADILGIDQAKVSALARGQLRGFSTDRLFRFLNALGQDIEIKVKRKPKSREAAQVHVVAT
jgi:predicted XRE-type DNA-binding protein